MKGRGIGDTVEAITKATGIARVVKSVSEAAGVKDCGCGKRRDALNKILPYKNQEDTK